MNPENTTPDPLNSPNIPQPIPNTPPTAAPIPQAPNSMSPLPTNGVPTTNTTVENTIQNQKSLLSEILANAETQQATTASVTPTADTTNSPQSPTPPNKPRDPMTIGKLLKLVGTLFLVGLIFFGTFLSYIVFNPSQASFFITVFHIDPADISSLLKSLINFSFGVITFSLSIAFIIALFQAIWTKKEQKRKKVLAIILSFLTGILLLLILTFWAYLFNKIKETDFTNPGGNIVVYDNDLYKFGDYRKLSEMPNLNNIIGPITLKYDISQNAKQVSNSVGGVIDRYSLDFNGAKCENGSSKFDGSDPTSELAIICTFDENRTYTPTGKYFVTLRTGEKKEIPITLSTVEVRGLLDISEIKNKDGQNVRILDAKKIKNLGSGPRWVYETEPGREIAQDILSVIPSDTPIVVGLRAFSKAPGFDRVFVIQNKNNEGNIGTIDVVQNPANPQEYTFSVTGTTANPSEIIGVNWKMNGVNICNDTKKEICNYSSNTYGDWNISAEVNIIGKNPITVTKTMRVNPPLDLDRHLKVTNRSGKQLNTDETIDPKTKAYIIKDITPPDTIMLDARDVISNNKGYVLQSVNWTIYDGKSAENRTGDKIEFAINRTARYTITAEYTFSKTIKTGQSDDTRTAKDTIMLDLEKKNLTPILKVTPNSGYVPIKVVVDASESQSEYSEIVKFEFDFGEGRPKTIGDAIQTYEYTTAGEKKITVTAIDSNNERASTTQVVVLKDTPKTVNFTTSVSPGTTGKTVDFTATNTLGQIEDFLWNFGDNSSIEHGESVSHTFKKSDVYNVTLTVKYMDGTEKSTTSTFKVVDSLE